MSDASVISSAAIPFSAFSFLFASSTFILESANIIVAFRAKCKMFSRHLQKPILKTEKVRFKGL